MNCPDCGAEITEVSVERFQTQTFRVNHEAKEITPLLGELGYRHEAIRGTDEVGEHPLPHCHRVAALLQRWLLETHQGAVRPSHLDYYLDEFTFRFNRRTSRSRGKRFYRLAQQAVAADPAPERALRGKKPERRAPQTPT